MIMGPGHPVHPVQAHQAHPVQEVAVVAADHRVLAAQVMLKPL